MKYNTNKIKFYILKLIRCVRVHGLLYTMNIIARKLKAKFLTKSNLNQGDGVNIYQSFEHNPFVSIIAVNYNGANDLPDFLNSIKNQSYKNFELIIVDNNSVDTSLDVIEKFKKSSGDRINIKLIKGEQNVGFAVGNNIGEENAEGELIALINVDTIAHIDWLAKLVEGLRYDRSAAAATSKILFKYRFTDVRITGSGQFNIDELDILNNIVYKKYFLRHGKKSGDKIFSENGMIHLSVPYETQSIALNIWRSQEDFQSDYEISVGRDSLEEIHEYNKEKNCYSVLINLSDSRYLGWIINNAGSVVNDNCGPQDRGFGEYDNGQYDSKAYVDAFCGCSVLVRRIAIAGRSLFVPEFFAYYEDSELSRFINLDGRILYIPQSIVYHRHSATSTEGSTFWTYLTQRSKFIYDLDESSVANTAEAYLQTLHLKYKDKIDPNVASWIESANVKLIDRFRDSKSIVQRKKSIGIYNEYWSTYGGGEVHALNLINKLENSDRVYMLSQSDFDKEIIKGRFGIDVIAYIKSIGPSINPIITKKFDIFINSTHHSNLDTFSKKSYYVVSFPHKKIYDSIKSKYIFLYNSKYTQSWGQRYWGDVKYNLYLPTASVNKIFVESSINFCLKQKKIINVGRFFKGGHSKKQLELLRSFSKSSLNDYILYFCGGINRNSKSDVTYLNEILETSNRLQNIHVEPNISTNELFNQYLDSLFVISATGYGEDSLNEPELFEHFGIAFLEAACMGCIPIVNSVGGPADMVDEFGVGYKFETEEDLLNILTEIKSLDFETIKEMSIRTSSRAREYVLNCNEQVLQ